MIIDFDNLSPWELSELQSLMSTEPYAGPLDLLDWESRMEAQDHVVEFGDMTAEDYRARAAYEAQMLADVWSGRAAA